MAVWAEMIGTAPTHAIATPTSSARPTERPTSCPAPTSASESPTSMPLALEPIRKYLAISPEATWVAATAANPADARAPQITAQRPSRASAPASAPLSPRTPEPTFSTSAAATPSGYGRSDVVTSARRSGMVNSTPMMPPLAHTKNDVQKLKPVHQPTITRPGRTKMMDASAPAADATVWTMLFSRTDESLKNESTAIEITAAGIDVANVSPTFNPR